MNRTRTLMRAAAALAACLTALAAHAQPVGNKLVVSTGDPTTGSTYSKMFTELREHCTPEAAGGLTLEEATSTGSVANIDALVSKNTVDAAIAQADVLFYRRSLDDSVRNVKTIVALHPEEVHFVARGDVKKEGGFLGMGAKEVRYDTVDNLRGRPVGAVGGSVVTARVISAEAGLNLQVVEFPRNDVLIKALLEGRIDAIVAVGGAPLPLVGNLDSRFRLLPVPDTIAKNKGVAEMYRTAKVTYSNLNASGVPTLQTDAILVSRVYRDPGMRAALGALRQCFYDKLPKIQDARGTHAKWQKVEADNRGPWDWYDLPSGAANVTAAQPAPAAQPATTGAKGGAKR